MCCRGRDLESTGAVRAPDPGHLLWVPLTGAAWCGKCRGGRDVAGSCGRGWEWL